MTTLLKWTFLVCICCRMTATSPTDRCTDIAIIRPAGEVHVAQHSTGWADISDLNQQLQAIIQHTNSLKANIESALTTIPTCTESTIHNNQAHRDITQDDFSEIIFLESKLKEVTSKTTEEKCNLPTVNQYSLSRMLAARKLHNYTNWEHLVAFLIVGPTSTAGKIGAVYALNNDKLANIPTKESAGMTSVPTDPSIQLVGLTLSKYSPLTDLNLATIGPGNKVMKFICIKPLRVFDLTPNSCTIIHKSRVEAILSSGLNTINIIHELVTGKITRLDAIPNIPDADVVGNTHLSRSPILDEVQRHLNFLENKDHVFNDYAINVIGRLQQLTSKITQSIGVTNERRLTYDYSSKESLPEVRIDITNQKIGANGKRFINGDIYGPKFSTNSLYNLDRLPNTEGTIIAFSHLMTHPNGTPIALEYNPQEFPACRKEGRTIICYQYPTSQKADASQCGKRLLLTDSNGCEERQTAPPGVHEHTAYCERNPKKYITSRTPEIIEHECEGEDKEKSTVIGTLSLDGKCKVWHNGREITNYEKPNQEPHIWDYLARTKQLEKNFDWLNQFNTIAFCSVGTSLAIGVLLLIRDKLYKTCCPCCNKISCNKCFSTITCQCCGCTQTSETPDTKIQIQSRRKNNIEDTNQEEMKDLMPASRLASVKVNM